MTFSVLFYKLLHVGITEVAEKTALGKNENQVRKKKQLRGHVRGYLE